MGDFLWQPWFVGAVGALAPEVVRAYKRRSRPKHLRFSTFYFFVSILYAALGGFLATLLAGDAQPIGWFYTGAALPFILDAGIKAQIPPPGGNEGSDDVEEMTVEALTWRDELGEFARTLTD